MEGRSEEKSGLGKDRHSTQYSVIAASFSKEDSQRASLKRPALLATVY
jgi:hypothetical protein